MVSFGNSYMLIKKSIRYKCWFLNPLPPSVHVGKWLTIIDDPLLVIYVWYRLMIYNSYQILISFSASRCMSGSSHKPMDPFNDTRPIPVSQQLRTSQHQRVAVRTSPYQGTQRSRHQGVVRSSPETHTTWGPVLQSRSNFLEMHVRWPWCDDIDNMGCL